MHPAKILDMSCKFAFIQCIKEAGHNLNYAMRKPVIGVADQVQHNPGCTVTADGLRLENADLGRRIVLPL